MASQAQTVELWDKLQPDGGVRKAVLPDWSVLRETNREDGDDSLVVAFPLTHSITATVANGWAARIVGEDAVIREYLVYVIEDDVNTDTCTLTCTGARGRLNTPTVADGTTTGTASACLTAACAGSGISWVTPTTSVSVGTISVTFSGDTVLSAVQKVVAAVDATLASGDPPCVFSFVMTSVSVYTLTLRTTVGTGTAHLLQGKNIARLTRRRDTTDPTWPLTSYTVLVDDLYRNAPATWPYDNLKPYETCRLEWPPLAIDAAVRIASVTTDHRNSIGTTVELGTPKRRLAQTTVAAIVAAEVLLPQLAIYESHTDTEYTIDGTSTGALTCSIDSGTPFVPTFPLTSIARNAWGGAVITYVFYCTLSGQTLVWVVHVLPQEPVTVPTVTSFTSDGYNDGGDYFTFSFYVVNVPAGGYVGIYVSTQFGDANATHLTSPGDVGVGGFVNLNSAGTPAMAAKCTLTVYNGADVPIFATPFLYVDYNYS